MKKSNLIILATFVVTFSCCQSSKGNLPILDVSANYPEKEISLTDIAEVRYLHLNSDQEEYLYRGSIQAMSPNRVVVTDARLGDIFLFSLEGMPVSHFNRRGNGPGEYSHIHRVFYDEAADDAFVVEAAPINIIHVYSSTGEHKRDIALPSGKMVMNDIVSFDDQSFFSTTSVPTIKWRWQMKQNQMCLLKTKLHLFIAYPKPMERYWIL